MCTWFSAITSAVLAVLNGYRAWSIISQLKRRDDPETGSVLLRRGRQFGSSHFFLDESFSVRSLTVDRRTSNIVWYRVRRSLRNLINFIYSKGCAIFGFCLEFWWCLTPRVAVWRDLCQNVSRSEMSFVYLSCSSTSPFLHLILLLFILVHLIDVSLKYFFTINKFVVLF